MRKKKISNRGKRKKRKKKKSKLLNIDIEEAIKRHYFIGKEIWEEKLIDIDKYLNTDKGENIVFEIYLKKEEEIIEKEGISQVEGVLYKVYPKPLINNADIPYRSGVMKDVSMRYKINTYNIKIGLNYEICVWIEIEKILLKKRDISILNENFLYKYKRSFRLFIKEVNRKEYINYYNHIEIIENSQYRNINEDKDIDDYIYKRIKKIVLDIIEIESFKDDGIGYLGVIFCIQIDSKSTLYIYSDNYKRKSLLRFYESRFPEFYKRIFNREKLIGNKYNPDLDSIIKGVLSNKKEVEKKEIKKEKEDEDILKDILKTN